MACGRERDIAAEATARMAEPQQRIRVATQVHARQARCAPAPRHIEVRVDLSGLRKPGERLLRLAGINEAGSEIGGVPLIVRIDLDRSPRVLYRENVVPLQQAQVTEDRMTRALAIVELDGPPCEDVRLLQHTARAAQVIVPTPAKHHGE